MEDKAVQGTALVVGGASGIGAACCRLMVRRGWQVIVADRDRESGASVAEEIHGEFRALDVTDVAMIESLAGQLASLETPLRGLVVSSGAFQEDVPIAQSDLSNVDRILKVNFLGTYALNRAFGGLMAGKGGGSIVNLASVVGHLSTPLNIYGPTKAAIHNMTKSLAGEWGRSGVRVNSVSPGITLVPRVVARRASVSRYPKNIDEQMALGRCVEPEEVAEAVEFLLSSRASAITGTDLVVDCGWMTAAMWTSYGGVRPPVGQ